MGGNPPLGIRSLACGCLSVALPRSELMESFTGAAEGGSLESLLENHACYALQQGFLVFRAASQLETVSAGMGESAMRRCQFERCVGLLDACPIGMSLFPFSRRGAPDHWTFPPVGAGRKTCTEHRE
ncbi:hypothetical protein K456DRAFT_430954 [Colletotrichum gloeosporioides 23]|nr:hypothetical protein K456DRAFT_430954 [Colletotrichum gloeosporioides 23]